MAWKTGEACGFTLTLSGASRYAKYRAVITVTRLALEAWWPPTLTPSPVSRSWLAASTMRVASHSTRCWIVSRTARPASVPASPAAVSAMFRSSPGAGADAASGGSFPALIAIPAGRVVNDGNSGRGPPGDGRQYGQRQQCQVRGKGSPWDGQMLGSEFRRFLQVGAWAVARSAGRGVAVARGPGRWRGRCAVWIPG